MLGVDDSGIMNFGYLVSLLYSPIDFTFYLDPISFIFSSSPQLYILFYILVLIISFSTFLLNTKIDLKDRYIRHSIIISIIFIPLIVLPIAGIIYIIHSIFKKYTIKELVYLYVWKIMLLISTFYILKFLLVYSTASIYIIRYINKNLNFIDSLSLFKELLPIEYYIIPIGSLYIVFLYFLTSFLSKSNHKNSIIKITRESIR